jgi:1,4-dihydroxy-6-naphthoate synthase
MKLSIGFSSCPNDTFIFDAMVNHKIDTEGLEWDLSLEDVETLNKWSTQGKLDITKLSFPAWFQAASSYKLLNSGSALGSGVGPLLISKAPVENLHQEINQLSIAIPGKNTTAFFLLKYAFPTAENVHVLTFNEIEDAVLSGKVDAGVIIHENRFTYQQKGLTKLVDLGEYWEKKTLNPIPLGGIAAKHSLGNELIEKIDRVIKRSLEYAFGNYPALPEFVTSNAQEMEEEVMRKHIDLYVNSYSLNLGEKGLQAIDVMRIVFNSLNKPGE